MESGILRIFLGNYYTVMKRLLHIDEAIRHYMFIGFLQASRYLWGRDTAGKVARVDSSVDPAIFSHYYLCI